MHFATLALTSADHVYVTNNICMISYHKMDLVFYQIGLSSVHHPDLTTQLIDSNRLRRKAIPVIPVTFKNAHLLIEINSRWLPHETGWENAMSVQSCHWGKGWLLWRISNIKYILICLTLFLVTTWFYMCYFVVLMSSLLFYNVENSKNIEKPLNE